jgi:hypothetical protein
MQLLSSLCRQLIAPRAQCHTNAIDLLDVLDHGDRFLMLKTADPNRVDIMSTVG